MGSEPIATEDVLAYNHCQSDEHGVGDAHTSVAGQSVAAEEETADDGLQQIVGEAHSAEGAEVAECTAHRLEGIPRRDHSRNNHEEYEEVVDRCEPLLERTEARDAQHGNDHG